MSAASYNLFQIIKELSVIGSGSGCGMSVNSAEPDENKTVTGVNNVIHCMATTGNAGCFR
uniref:Uncharacterized protein n=1 Tax=Timema shepardi TaxID=629360 RepID=A0A7R9FVI4_TIMSH|nr:unnamed protein product [Timema shepardi]